MSDASRCAAASSAKAERACVRACVTTAAAAMGDDLRTSTKWLWRSDPEQLPAAADLTREADKEDEEEREEDVWWL